VFIPKQAAMARVLRQRRIPYVIKPGGGLLPPVLRRGVIKKALYTTLVERPRFMGASAIVIVTPGEERAIRAYVPDFQGPIRWIPNAVPLDDLGPHRWDGSTLHQGQKRIVFLGRFDVLHKGLDILIEIARLLPDVQFDLHGTEDAKTRDWLERLKRTRPANVAFRDPIFGHDKGKVLAESCLYIQPSRWEVFGNSVAQCLSLGVPTAITQTMDLAQLYHEHDLGLVIPLDAAEAAAQIRMALADPERMHDWSRRGRQFAQTNFHPRTVAEKYLALYREVIASGRRREAHPSVIMIGDDAAPPATEGVREPHSAAGLRAWTARSNASALVQRSRGRRLGTFRRGRLTRGAQLTLGRTAPE
jgi:glycosyltransferase involved in cell wall biosynthesis